VTVRVDCHLHTVESGDATTTFDQLSPAALAAGLDVVFVTDHNHLTPLPELPGVRLVAGEEIRTRSGEILGLFLTERVPYVLPVDEAVALVRAQGGIVVAPHPYDPLRGGLGDALPQLCRAGLIDAVEGFNAKIADSSLNDRAAATAAAHGLPITVGSDAHDPQGVGAAYLEMPDFDGPAAFLRALRAATAHGEYRPHAPRYPTR
jgi:predicted metal-dependent phosphoesterase TrpH